MLVACERLSKSTGRHLLRGSQVGTLRTITGCSDKIAIECLNAGGWSVEGAVEVRPFPCASPPRLPTDSERWMNSAALLSFK